MTASARLHQESGVHVLLGKWLLLLSVGKHAKRIHGTSDSKGRCKLSAMGFPENPDRIASIVNSASASRSFNDWPMFDPWSRPAFSTELTKNLLYKALNSRSLNAEALTLLCSNNQPSCRTYMSFKLLEDLEAQDLFGEEGTQQCHQRGFSLTSSKAGDLFTLKLMNFHVLKGCLLGSNWAYAF